MNDNEKKHAADAFTSFLEVIATLRSPDGCPWDREQTAMSLRGDLIEEVYECIDAINAKDAHNLREELGDLFLLITMISYIAQQDEEFTVKDVLQEITEKLIRRHPHVFAETKQMKPDEVIVQWDEIKRDIEGKDRGKSTLDSVPASLPPLEKAYKYQKKAAKAGFDWTDKKEVSAKVYEELQELQDAEKLQKNNRDEIEKELGDILFSVVNLCRHYKVDPAIALHRTNGKFYKRFCYVERGMKENGKSASPDELEYMEKLWNESKLREK